MDLDIIFKQFQWHDDQQNEVIVCGGAVGIIYICIYGIC